MYTLGTFNTIALPIKKIKIVACNKTIVHEKSRDSQGKHDTQESHCVRVRIWFKQVSKYYSSSDFFDSTSKKSCTKSVYHRENIDLMKFDPR